MTNLAEHLTAPGMRAQVVAACVDLVEQEVSAKGGLSGAAIKAGYKVIKAIKPGMVPAVIDGLLPEFAASLQPLYDRATDGAADKSQAFTTYLDGHADEAADALLTVTDKRAERTPNKTLRKTYDRLRGSAKDNVRAAIPGLARALAPHLP